MVVTYWTCPYLDNKHVQYARAYFWGCRIRGVNLSQVMVSALAVALLFQRQSNVWFTNRENIEELEEVTKHQHFLWSQQRKEKYKDLADCFSIGFWISSHSLVCFFVVCRDGWLACRIRTGRLGSLGCHVFLVNLLPYIFSTIFHCCMVLVCKIQL